MLFAFIYPTSRSQTSAIGPLLFDHRRKHLIESYIQMSLFANRNVVIKKPLQIIIYCFTCRFLDQLWRMVSLVGLVYLWSGLHSPPSKVMQPFCHQVKFKWAWPAMSRAGQRCRRLHWWIVRQRWVFFTCVTCSLIRMKENGACLSVYNVCVSF